jgi:protein SCO1/2
MKSAKWWILGALLVVLIAISWATRLENQNQNEEIQNPYGNVGGEFTLVSKDGLVSLSDYRGRIVLLFFGYTLCPDVCPTTLAKIGAVFRELSINEVSEVWGMFITVDPERDTIEKVSKYADFFHENIIGLTGSPEKIEKVAEKYFVLYQKIDHEDPALGYTVDHSATTYLIGRDGQVVELFRHRATIEEIVQSIRVTLDD